MTVFTFSNILEMKKTKWKKITEEELSSTGDEFRNTLFNTGSWEELDPCATCCIQTQIHIPQRVVTQPHRITQVLLVAI